MVLRPVNNTVKVAPVCGKNSGLSNISFRLSLTIPEISSVDEAVLLGGNVLGTGTNADKLDQLKKKHPDKTFT